LQQLQVLSTLEVLSQEFEHIWKVPAAFQSEDDYRTAALARNQAALCLSGGGIRSAAFSLGVIQGLAKKALLTRFHYLSTVSGGGYIGAWLCRWINDEKNHDAGAIEKALAGDNEKPLPNLPEIQALRENSNYLTPKVGLTSVDFWTALTLSIRNIILNWLIFLPALFSIATFFNLYLELLSPKSCITLPSSVHDWSRAVINQAIQICPIDFSLFCVYSILGSAALFVATFFAHRYLPSLTAAQLNTKQLIQRVVIPTFIFSLSMPLLLSFNFEPSFQKLTAFFMIWLVTCLASIAAGLVIFIVSKKFKTPLRNRIAIFVDVILWLVGAAILVGTIVVALCVADLVPDVRYRLLLVAVVAPAILTWSQTMQAAFYVGFRREQFRADADREWLARLSAMRVLPAQMWMIFALACLVLPALITNSDWLSRAFGAVASFAGLIAVIGGRSTKIISFQANRFQANRSSKKKLMLSISAAVNIATAVFIGGVFAGLAWLEGVTAAWFLETLRGLNVFDRWAHNASNYEMAAAHLIILLLAILFVRGFGKRINVNRFSLHGVYRNRLVRTFLGGARRRRTPDLFTGFDPQDNIRMQEINALVGKGELRQRVLFPVINLTMNLVRGDKLAWQERKAGPFTVTPLSCGSAILGAKLDTKSWQEPPGCFVSSEIYGGAEPDLGNSGRGISLGTAMTISGAAASPSMGYHSSPGTAFLMTLFNVRLGAWLGNPASPRMGDLARSSPDDALRPLFAEMFGQTNDRGRDIYLSDGGHFENLGLYEMVRRRCRYIFVVDGSCDPECRLEDLGNAIRKIYIDQNIDIEFDNLNLSSREAAKELVGVAIGKIRYPDSATEPGWLIYLKASYFSSAMPADVRAYGEANPDFPHETTMEQWFTESQFESYRKLGAFLVDRLGNSRDPCTDLGTFFAEICNAKGDRQPSDIPVLAT
jgi:hypothetical protein